MQEIMIKETQSSIDRREEDSVDKNNRRESLIQSKETDVEEHAVFSYHIKTLNDLVIKSTKTSQSSNQC
jgi:hypothetical protein